MDKALYGFRESPRCWASHRDSAMREMRQEYTLPITDANFQKKTRRLVQCQAEENLWMLVEAYDEHSDLENHTLLGLVLVYVDDFMIMGFKDTILWFEKELRARWEATDLDWAGQQAPVRFCGMDIYRDWNGSYHASQRAYVRELVKRHGLDGASQNMPIPTFDEPEEEADRTAEEVRAAQQIAGELQWVATKTRVDVAYAVSRVGSATVRSPRWAVQTGLGILKYLNATEALGLEFNAGAIDQRQDGTLEREIEVYTDASFAPGGGVSHGCEVFMWGGCTILWSSSKQPFPALSTAEAELIALLEGVVMGESVGCIFEEILGKQRRLLFCDNTAAISLATVKGGNWRTRHLKVRAAHLRWKTENGHWRIEHRPGAVMVADIGTKPLKPIRFSQLNPLVGLKCMSDWAEEYMRYGYEGGPPQEPTWRDDPDPGAFEPTDWQDREVTPPTDEEMAKVRAASFRVDMEKVNQLVKVIAVFQSIEGVSAQMAEGDEEKTYIHMVIFGVVMAMLGAAVHYLLRRWWTSSSRSDVVKDDGPTAEEVPTPRVSALRVESTASTESTLAPLTTPRRRAGAGARGAEAKAKSRPGPSREMMRTVMQRDPMESFIAERGGDRQTFIEDLAGTQWREVYRYLDDRVVVNVRVENGENVVRELDLGENAREIAGAGPGPRDGPLPGADPGGPGGRVRAGGDPPGGFGAAAGGVLGGLDLAAAAGGAPGGGLRPLAAGGTPGGDGRASAAGGNLGGGLRSSAAGGPLGEQVRRDVRRSPTGGARRSLSQDPDMIGPVITEHGSRFHMDLNCPTLHRSRKSRKQMCRMCGFRNSIHAASLTFLDVVETVHTDEDCPRIVGAAVGCGRCMVCSALRT